uniref:hypothetical protein n=1 Tax=Flavobacterium sp. TaxID=239 RepID=UPI0040493BA6
MRTLGTFEIFEIYKIKFGLALAGKLISEEPISNRNDILKKNIFISFIYNDKKFTEKIIQLDGRFGRLGQDLIMERNDNIALLIEITSETEVLSKFESSTILGEIFEK